jgi:hypothetical protein
MLYLAKMYSSFSFSTSSGSLPLWATIVAGALLLIIVVAVAVVVHALRR